jgi:hypothetical protein
MPQLPDRDIPAEITAQLRKWNRMARCLRFLQVGLGVIGTVSAFAVTTFAGELGTLPVKGFSCAAALAIGILTAFDIGGKANATRQAHRLLNLAVVRYLYLAAPSLDNLFDSYAQAQEIVGGVTYRHLEAGDTRKA